MSILTIQNLIYTQLKMGSKQRLETGKNSKILNEGPAQDPSDMQEVSCGDSRCTPHRRAAPTKLHLLYHILVMVTFISEVDWICSHQRIAQVQFSAHIHSCIFAVGPTEDILLVVIKGQHRTNRRSLSCWSCCHQMAPCPQHIFSDTGTCPATAGSIHAAGLGGYLHQSWWWC